MHWILSTKLCSLSDTPCISLLILFLRGTWFVQMFVFIVGTVCKLLWDNRRCNCMKWRSVRLLTSNIYFYRTQQIDKNKTKNAFSSFMQYFQIKNRHARSWYSIAVVVQEVWKVSRLVGYNRNFPVMQYNS